MQEMQETWVWSLSQEGSPRVGNGNPVQYSCLGNPMDRGTWQATVHGVSKTWTWISTLVPHGFLVRNQVYYSAEHTVWNQWFFFKIYKGNPLGLCLSSLKQKSEQKDPKIPFSPKILWHLNLLLFSQPVFCWELPLEPVDHIRESSCNLPGKRKWTESPGRQ